VRAARQRGRVPIGTAYQMGLPAQVLFSPPYDEHGIGFPAPRAPERIEGSRRPKRRRAELEAARANRVKMNERWEISYVAEIGSIPG
jgi:hypothetical protein